MRSKGGKVNVYMRNAELRDWMAKAEISPSAVLSMAAERLRAALGRLDPDAVDLLEQVDHFDDPTLRSLILGTILPDRLPEAVRASQ